MFINNLSLQLRHNNLIFRQDPTVTGANITGGTASPASVNRPPKIERKRQGKPRPSSPLTSQFSPPDPFLSLSLPLSSSTEPHLHPGLLLPSPDPSHSPQARRRVRRPAPGGHEIRHECSLSALYGLHSIPRLGCGVSAPTEEFIGLVASSCRDNMVECTRVSTLLDGLPNEVALQCLARVPFVFHPVLQLVCRSWRASVCSGELLNVRNEVGATEELLCVLAFEPENVWQLYDPLRDKWITLPVMPSQIRNIARFGVASVAGKLYVIGGGSDRVDPLTGDHDTIFASNEVWSYDPLNRLWTQRAPMLVARAMFACCALGGKIIVAGGLTNCRKSISEAESYDPEADTWESIPDLRHAHPSACSGLVIKDKMHVFHKGISTVQILEDGGGYWAVEDCSWLQGPMAMVGGELYVLSNSCIMKQRGENFSDKMVPCASGFQSRIGFGMIGLGDSICLFGGVIGPGPRNQCIKPLSDLDILNVTSERPTWRPGSPMTHCRGSITGCALLRI